MLQVSFLEGKSDMRLDKFLAHTGFGTRKETKDLLKKKAVEVNGVCVKDGKFQVKPVVDQVAVYGEAVAYQEFIYLMLHKPQGVVSATIDNVNPTVIDLLTPAEQKFEPFPVGRLDKDTEGLLILTNDGVLAHELLSPKKHVAKRYEATIDGIVTQEDRDAFKKGIVLSDGYQCQPAELEIVSVMPDEGTSSIFVTIHEGKFHQVKRMFEACGKKVVYLKRAAMGLLELDPNLPLGKYRPLTQEELNLLKGID